jgi:hypothetical protein
MPTPLVEEWRPGLQRAAVVVVRIAADRKQAVRPQRQEALDRAAGAKAGDSMFPCTAFIDPLLRDADRNMPIKSSAARLRRYRSDAC